MSRINDNDYIQNSDTDEELLEIMNVLESEGDKENGAMENQVRNLLHNEGL